MQTRDKCLARIRDDQRRKIIREWVNLKTDEDGFTALHFASFRGNLKVISMLIENGADIAQVNNHGLSMLHVAAQGDQAIALYYFKESGLKVDLTDHRRSTPLHWACYSK